jgi:hypothetical protein
MGDMQAALTRARAAVGELIEVSQRCERVWTTPPAPGRWSPSQIVEHVARALETIASTIFGAIRLEDWVRFQELHTRHHRKQMAA